MTIAFLLLKCDKFTIEVQWNMSDIIRPVGGGEGGGANMHPAFRLKLILSKAVWSFKTVARSH